MPSFDAVSKVDMQEVDNAVNQARKELQSRYDFRNSKSEIQFDRESITLLADDSMKLKALSDILKERLAKRGIGLKCIEFRDPESAAGGALRQHVEIKQGISTDDGRKLVKLVKESGMKKVQAQIQQDQVRVTAPKKDDLQAVIKLLRETAEIELQFTNFKD
jgi:cyclic-di-GMP-binding protein